MLEDDDLRVKLSRSSILTPDQRAETAYKRMVIHPRMHAAKTALDAKVKQVCPETTNPAEQHDN